MPMRYMGVAGIGGSIVFFFLITYLVFVYKDLGKSGGAITLPALLCVLAIFLAGIH